MTCTIRQFNQALFEEHLDELAGLYDLRLAWQDDPELHWVDVADFEARMDAHIDALMVGGEHARTVMVDALAEADPGALYGIACVACRQLDGKLLSEIWETVELEDEGIASVIALALLHERPTQWIEYFTSILASKHAMLLPVVAPVVAEAGKISDELAAKLIQRIEKGAGVGLSETLLAAIGKAGEARSAALLPSLLQHEAIAIRTAALRCQLMLGANVDPASVAAVEPTVLLLLSLCSGKTLLPGVSMQQFATDDGVANITQTYGASEALVASLGLVGTLPCAKALVGYLQNEELAALAAQALQLMLGVDLRDKTFVEETFEKEDLFESEKENFDKGIMPKRGDGVPFGDKQSLLSTDSRRWVGWLKENHGHFVPGNRYRGGKVIPLQPSAADTAGISITSITTIADDATAPLLRKILMDELYMQYGIAVSGIDDRVVSQRYRLHMAAQGTA